MQAEGGVPFIKRIICLGLLEDLSMVEVGMREYTGETTSEGGKVFDGRAGYSDSV